MLTENILNTTRSVNLARSADARLLAVLVREEDALRELHLRLRRRAVEVAWREGAASRDQR